MMHASPVLSIVLPTFNAAGLLAGCLESLAPAREGASMEVLVMDGLSTDGTVALARSFGGRLPGLRTVVGKDAGIYDAMNKGLESALGEWVCFLGADDRWFDADRILGILRAAGSGIDMVQVNARKGVSGFYTRCITPGRVLAGEEFNHQTLFYRRSFVGGLRYSLDYPLAADQLFNMELVVRRRARVLHVPELLVDYANTGASAQRKDDRWIADKHMWIARMFPAAAVARRERWRSRERWVKRIVRLVAGGKASRWAVEAMWDGLY